MKLLLRLLVTAALVLLIAHFLKGVHVASFTTAIIVAIVLGLLNIFIKPIISNLNIASNRYYFGLVFAGY